MTRDRRRPLTLTATLVTSIGPLDLSGRIVPMRRCILPLLMLLASAGTGAAQTPAAQARPPEPALRRWFEFQQFVLGTRYRIIETSSDVVTSNHMQYREQIRARVNFDPKKRYTVNAGFYSGSSFTGSWDNLGPGTGDFNGH